MKCTKLLLCRNKVFLSFLDATTAACSRSIMILVNLQHKSHRQRSWNALLAVDKNCRRVRARWRTSVSIKFPKLFVEQMEIFRDCFFSFLLSHKKPARCNFYIMHILQPFEQNIPTKQIHTSRTEVSNVSTMKSRFFRHVPCIINIFSASSAQLKMNKSFSLSEYENFD